jgi:hypothetical protein
MCWFLHRIAATNHSYSGDAMERRKSISSLASEDSVNLDDLIKANFTLDMDDETDLPNLANLDLGDDSKEDFWKMDKVRKKKKKKKKRVISLAAKGNQQCLGV